MKKQYDTEWSGTIKDLKEWLEQFNDDDDILITGGSDSGGEFLDIIVNGEVVA